MTDIKAIPPARGDNHRLTHPQRMSLVGRVCACMARFGVLGYAGIAMAVIAFVFIVLAIVGGVRQYLPVPYWDMWQGYVGFLTQSDLSTWQAWWGQHNEHRILISRLLFWLDFNVFGASFIFLVVVNYLLAAAAVLLLLWALRERIGSTSARSGALLIAALIPVAGFSWTQSENFNWAFQSQFFLAQSVPLAALLALYRSQSPMHRGGFVGACALGVAACGTMANGVGALPLMVVMAVLSGHSKRRILILGALTVAMLGYYFSDYQSSAAARSIDVLTLHAVALAQYTLVYLGAPVFWAISNQAILQPSLAAPLAAVAGSVLLMLAFGYLVHATRREPRDGLGIALSLFILYVAATALLTALGRYDNGVAQAASSRYQTPVLMAWCALLVLLAPALLRGLARLPWLGAAALLVIPIVMWPVQHSALNHDRDRAFERWIAVLALDMGVRDQQQIGRIYPNVDHALLLSKPLDAEDVGVFGDPLLDPVDETMGSLQRSDVPVLQCSGALTALRPIVGDARFLQLEGEISSPWARRTQSMVSVLDKDGRVVGFAVTMARGRDARNDATSQHDLTRFSGYVDAKQLGATLVLIGQEPACKLQVQVPIRPFTIRQ
ncbi:hypothetical protein RBI14_04245 [Alcaligenaceae bacterium B3P038]|nr:hypothetical protein [Alcaligenaceae bacterium B3P038]